MASVRAPPGSIAPVMSMLFAAQTDIMTLSAGDLKEALKCFDKAPDVSSMGMFTNHPDDIGASMRVLEDVTTMVEYCAAYGIGHITMEAARRCEKVADDTPALDAEWAKFHNPWENAIARPRQVKRWGEGREAD